MSLIDYVFWGAILIGGVALTVLYGRSWRAVARALAEAEQSAQVPVAGAVDRLPAREPDVGHQVMGSVLARR